jgi:hypothetical protein
VNEQEPTLELFRGDNLLAILSNIRLFDWPWYICDFQPTAEFEQYRPLFDMELALLEDKGATEEWDVAYGKIEELKLTLAYPLESKVTDIFLIHIEGDTARFKAVYD